jgi:DNA repair protein SbcC/Rad50
MVHDAISNECQPMSSASGGERVWLNEAVMRGVALYLQSQTQWPHKTLFSDETDGPLDSGRKLAFIASKRLTLKLGDLDAEVFITQTRELRDLADHLIDLDRMVA